MTTTPHPRLFAVFDEVVKAPPDEQPAIVDRECAGDPLLRHQLERLLASDADTGNGTPYLSGSVGSPAAFQQALTGADYPPGTIIGEYQIECVIGRGGFGVVYLATQTTLGSRKVALKILEGTSPLRARRFEEEQRLLANLRHPGIAQIYTRGTTAAGHPYFAMELVAANDGKPALHITKYANQQGLTVRERVALFVKVCDAVHCAHEQMVVHRDLKPSNILVEEQGGRVQPKVIDFGIARHLNANAASNRSDPTVGLTRSGEAPGTPQYMSPEQAAGKPVDYQSDVYSLGAVLYQLLCDTVPLPSLEKDLPVEERLRVLRDEVPALASKAVRRAPDSKPTSSRTNAAQIAKELRGDLDTILERSLAKERELRFPSARDFAEDLQRYLNNQPIESRKSLVYTLRKLVRRHRLFVAAVALVFLSLVAGAVGGLSFAKAADRQQAETLQVLAAIGHLHQAQSALASHDGGALHRSLDNVPADQRQWEWHHMRHLSDRSVRCIEGFEDMVSALAIHDDGQRLLAGDRKGTVSMWDSTGSSRLVPIWKPEASEGCDVWSVAWSPAGDRFATGSFDGKVRVHGADGSLLWVPKTDNTERAVYAVAFSRDGHWLAVGTRFPPNPYIGHLSLYDAARKANVPVWQDHSHTGPITDLAFSADHKWLASSADDGTIRLWRLGGSVPEPGGVVVVTEEFAVNAVAFSPDSSLLAAGTTNWEVKLYRVPGRKLVQTLTGHRDALASVAFHPDGSKLASASWDSTVRLWSIPYGELLDVFLGHRSRVNRVAFSADGSRLFSASDDKTVREWDPTSRSKQRALRVGRWPITMLGMLANGDLVVQTYERFSAYTDLRIVAADDGATRVPLGHIKKSFSLSPDGLTLAWMSDRCLHTWRADRKVMDHPCPHAAFAELRAFVAVDDYVVVASDSAVLRLDHRANSWDVVEPVPPPLKGFTMVHAWLTEGGRGLASTWTDHAGSSFVLRNGKTSPTRVVRPQHDGVSSGPYLVSVEPTSNRELKVHNVDSDTPQATLVGHRESVLSAAFSPDRERLASVSVDRTLRIWDWQQSQQVLSIPYPNTDGRDSNRFRWFSSVAWSPDGNTLVTGSTDGVVHFWPSLDR